MMYHGSVITDKPDAGSWLGFVLWFGGCAMLAGEIIIISVLIR